jgi:CheY-like chemotaxis protein
VVDDHGELREMIRAILEAKGYRTEGASDGHAALEHLRWSGRKPNLILVDLMMPAMNGCEFVAHLELHEDLRHIPFMLMTAHRELALRSNQIALGGNCQTPRFRPTSVRRALSLLANAATRSERVEGRSEPLVRSNLAYVTGDLPPLGR